MIRIHEVGVSNDLHTLNVRGQEYYPLLQANIFFARHSLDGGKLLIFFAG